MHARSAGEPMNGKRAHNVIGCTEPWVPDDELVQAMLTDACVLLTGKLDVAAALAARIHVESGWRHGRFTVIDCAQPIGLETRLVAALTTVEGGASQPHARLAQAGTIFLQEVGQMPLHMQACLRDRLGEMCVRGQWRRRVIASTSGCLLSRVTEGTFDDCLFYRLNVIHIRLTERTHSA